MFRLRLKELRENAGYSQYTFADAFGVAQSTVGSWEAGKREPNLDTIQRIADFFSVTVDYLLGRTDERPKDEEGTKNEKMPEILGAAAHFDLSKLTPEGVEEYNKYIEFLAFKYKDENID